MSEMSNKVFRALCENTRNSVLEAKRKKEDFDPTFGGKKAPPFTKKESRQQMRLMQKEIKQHLSQAAKLSTEMVNAIKSEDGGGERVATFKAEMKVARETIENAYKALAGN